MNSVDGKKLGFWPVWGPRFVAVGLAVPVAGFTLLFCFVLAMSGLPLVGVVTFPVGLAAVAASIGAAFAWMPGRPVGYAFASLFGFAAGWSLGAVIFFAFDYSPVVDRDPIYTLPIGWAALGLLGATSLKLWRRGNQAATPSFCSLVAIALFATLGVFMTIHSYRVIAFEVPQAGRRIATFDLNQDGSCLAASPQATLFAVTGQSGDSGDVQLVDTATAVALDPPPEMPVCDVAFSSNKPVLAIGCRTDERSSVCLWDLDASKQVHQMELGQELISLDYSPNGQYLKTLSWDESSKVVIVTLWNADSWTTFFELQTDAAVLGGSRTWNGELYRPAARGTEGASFVIVDEATAVSPDNRSVAIVKTGMSWSEPALLEIWSVQKQKTHSATLPVPDVRFIRFLPGGKLLVVGTTIAEYDPATGALREILLEPAPVCDISFSLARCFQEPRLARYSPETNSLCVSPDGRILAMGGGRIVGGDGFPTYANAILWDVQTGRFLGEILYEQVDTWVDLLAISPDGKTLALLLRDPRFRPAGPRRVELFDITSTTDEP